MGSVAQWECRAPCIISGGRRAARGYPESPGRKARVSLVYHVVYFGKSGSDVSMLSRSAAACLPGVLGRLRAAAQAPACAWSALQALQDPAAAWHAVALPPLPLHRRASPSPSPLLVLHARPFLSGFAAETSKVYHERRLLGWVPEGART